MALQLENERCYTKHHWSVYEQNSIVNSVREDDLTAECATIASNALVWMFQHKTMNLWK